jgi:hypothetical protein
VFLISCELNAAPSAELSPPLRNKDEGVSCIFRLSPLRRKAIIGRREKKPTHPFPLPVTCQLGTSSCACARKIFIFLEDCFFSQNTLNEV